MRIDRLGNDLTAKIIMAQMIGEQVDQHSCLEQINSHRAQQWAFRVIAADKLILDFGIFRLFDKVRDPAIRFALQDSQTVTLRSWRPVEPPPLYRHLSPSDIPPFRE